MEVKLGQQLASLEQCSLYGIFLDLKKVYDAMDRTETAASRYFGTSALE